MIKQNIQTMSVVRPQPKTKYVCRASRLIFKTKEAYLEHLKSDLYQFNLKRRSVGLNPITPAQWEQLKKQKEEENQKSGTRKKKGHIKNKIRAENRKKRREAAKEHEKQRKEEMSQMTEDEIIEEMIEGKESIPIHRSLFCSYESKDLESNLDFMKKTYGFIIPERDLCHNIEGLVSYLGEKIGIGNYSIWNNKQFRSVQSCQQHMRDTGTCKMLWHGNEFEYEDFYDLEAIFNKYEKQATSIKTADNGVEYVVGDKVIGHRGLQLYYKQRPRNTDIIDFEEHRMEVEKMKQLQKATNLTNKEHKKIMYETMKREISTNKNQKYFKSDNPIL